jgi:putative PIN family toxin of toxin-antitoxin system
MRVVVDTNVFISAALKERSLPSDAVRLVAERHALLKSIATEQELFFTIARPRLAPLIPPRFRDWLREIMAAAESVQIAEQIAACRDPKDDKFLELAVNGRADLIVSGDSDLIDLRTFRGVSIVTAADFLRAERRQAAPR